MLDIPDLDWDPDLTSTYAPLTCLAPPTVRGWQAGCGTVVAPAVCNAAFDVRQLSRLMIWVRSIQVLTPHDLGLFRYFGGNCVDCQPYFLSDCSLLVICDKVRPIGHGSVGYHAGRRVPCHAHGLGC